MAGVCVGDEPAGGVMLFLLFFFVLGFLCCRLGSPCGIPSAKIILIDQRKRYVQNVHVNGFQNQRGHGMVRDVVRKFLGGGREHVGRPPFLPRESVCGSGFQCDSVYEFHLYSMRQNIYRDRRKGSVMRASHDDIGGDGDGDIGDVIRNGDDGRCAGTMCPDRGTNFWAVEGGL